MAAMKSAHAAPAFDSDSVVLHVDNCSSRCLTNNISDIDKPPVMVRGNVKGLGGQRVAVKGVGTISWTFDDDNGRAHNFKIPGSLYVPDSPATLFHHNIGLRQTKMNTHAPMVHGKERLPGR